MSPRLCAVLATVILAGGCEKPPAMVAKSPDKALLRVASDCSAAAALKFAAGKDDARTIADASFDECLLEWKKVAEEAHTDAVTGADHLRILRAAFVPQLTVMVVERRAKAR